MTELDALRAVRAKFPLAIPQVVGYGEVRCLQANVTVALLNLQADGSWVVNWSPPVPEAAVAVAPPETPTEMEATEVATSEATQVLAAETLQSTKKSK